MWSELPRAYREKQGRPAFMLLAIPTEASARMLIEFFLNFARLRLLRTSEGNGSPQFKSRVQSWLSDLLACRAHEQILPVLYRGTLDGL